MITISGTGSAVAALLLLPSIVGAVLPPRNVPASSHDAGRIYTLLERTGQVSSLALLVCAGAETPDLARPDIWQLLVLLSLAAYYLLWGRYFVNRREYAVLYAPLGPLPIPLAVMPVLTLGCAAFWFSSALLGVAAVPLAIGHWTNSWTRYESTR